MYDCVIAARKTRNGCSTHLYALHLGRPDLVKPAIQNLLSQNHELRWVLVMGAYLEKDISLGKAAEMLDMHELALRERFIQLGIALHIGPADLAEAQAEVEALRQWPLDPTKSTLTYSPSWTTQSSLTLRRCGDRSYLDSRCSGAATTVQVADELNTGIRIGRLPTGG